MKYLFTFLSDVIPSSIAKKRKYDLTLSVHIASQRPGMG